MREFSLNPQHAADVCFRSVQPRSNVRLVGTRQQLFLQTQLRVSLILRHVFRHQGDVDSECADHAAEVGDHGMHGTLKAEFEANVLWKTAELTSYWCLLKKCDRSYNDFG